MHQHVLDLAGVCTGNGPCDITPNGLGNNWVTKAGGLPLYIRAVSKAFRRKGLPESEAISRAIGVVRNWAEGKGNVTAATRARAAAAIAEWERKKAQAHLSASGESVDLAGWNAAAHPKAPAGSSAGGQFITVGSGKSSDAEAEQVRAAQYGLGVGTTGQLSTGDAAAVKAYQKANGLQVDGIIGRQTAQALALTNKAGRSNPNAGKAAAKIKPGALTMKDRLALANSVNGKNLSAPTLRSVDLAARTDLLRRAVVAHKAGKLSPQHQQMLKTYLTRVRKRKG